MAYRFLRFPEGKTKAVTLSYDDGCKADLRLAETIEKYGMKCTFNINSKRLANGQDLTADDMKDLMARGHEAAVHGHDHLACGIVSAAMGINDVITCRKALETTFSKIIRGMAYPDTGITALANGTDYSTVKPYLTDLGIVYSRTLGGDNDSFELPCDWHAWMPTAHHSNPEIFAYIDKFLSADPDSGYTAKRHPLLFYMWGHSFEFDSNNNWELLDRICEKLGGNDDVWYATNIEIYEYVNAYNSLIWSADDKKVYNPTLIPVYFQLPEKAYCVLPGKTLTISF
ncbi:MAG: polysaccharide deacetylase family protein [Clostridia bacterium]|nr:polysaccharide deacetylase family protein [Clostridia bacterium]